MTPLPGVLKKAVEDAFHDNSLLGLIPSEDWEQAAQWYEAFAMQTGGSRADLARLYNLERAKFLRREVVRIARSAPDFAAEIGYGQTGV